MVDRVYKSSLPKLRRDLEKLKRSFFQVNPRTNWARLRIDPLIQHVTSLEKLLRSKEHSREFMRLRKGVVLFRSDLVYFGTNVRGLKNILDAEGRSLHQKIKRKVS
jgi:hypothetical protein